jgi:hypothetical protein
VALQLGARGLGGQCDVLFGLGVDFGRFDDRLLGDALRLRQRLFPRFLAQGSDIGLDAGQAALHFSGARFGLLAQLAGFGHVLDDLGGAGGEEWAAVLARQISQSRGQDQEVGPFPSLNTAFAAFAGRLRAKRRDSRQT